MTPRVGDLAPDFAARSDNGQPVALAGLRGQWVLLFFYPRASSPGCSIEAQRFEAALPEFERRGALVVGVSTDTEARQAQFRDKCDLSYPLLPDGDRTICRAYGVIGGLGGLLNMAARQSFLIGPDGRLAHHWRGVNPMTHASEVLKVLDQLGAPAASAQPS